MPNSDPEYRRDPITGRWVIIAPERAARPLVLAQSKPHARRNVERDVCPLCQGQEHDTPHEVYAVRRPDSHPNEPGWDLRVVPNKFPAVRAVEGALAGSEDLFEMLPGFGTHELVIECPDHETSPTALSEIEFARVLTAYRDRLRELAHDPRYAYVTVFKNVGAEAGASLAHLHSQIVATPIVPELVETELSASADYHAVERRCVFCDVLKRELADGARVVAEVGGFVAICPYAPRFAYETWILPTHHASGFDETTPIELGKLAELMLLVLGKIDAALGQPAYNYYLHTAPPRQSNLPYFHWHFEILPRTSRQAGFEWGSGCFINSVPPEKAAAELRTAVPVPDIDAMV
jgi:UDPglucose--hexose-1-phosphate uridylyltransferase